MRRILLACAAVAMLGLGYGVTEAQAQSGVSVHYVQYGGRAVYPYYSTPTYPRTIPRHFHYNPIPYGHYHHGHSPYGSHHYYRPSPYGAYRTPHYCPPQYYHRGLHIQFGPGGRFSYGYSF